MYVGFGNVCDAEVVLFCNFKIYIYIPLRIYYDCLTRSLTAYQVTALRQAFVINVFKKHSPLFLRIDYSVDTANFRYFFLLYSYFGHTSKIYFKIDSLTIMQTPITNTTQPKAGLSFSALVLLESDIPMKTPIMAKADTFNRNSQSIAVSPLSPKKPINDFAAMMTKDVPTAS